MRGGLSPRPGVALPALVALVVLVLGAGVAGCGGEDDPAAVEEPAGSAADTPTTTNATPTGGGADGPTGSAATVESVEVTAPGTGGTATATVSGFLPTPCHRLDWSVSPPDPANRVAVELRTTAEPDRLCAQVVEPFTAEIELGALPPGTYEAVVAGGSYPFTIP
jgi:hypothetical protein